MYFLVTINPPTNRSRERYIIIATTYLIRWAKEKPIEDCNSQIATWFMFENVVIKFGCPRILMSDQGTHFLNNTITALIEEI